MTAAGGALAAVGVIHQGLATYQEQQRIDADAFMTERQKNEQKARALPFGVGRLYGGVHDFFNDVTGRTKLMQDIERRHQEETAANRVRIRAADVGMSAGFTEASAEVAEALKGFGESLAKTITDGLQRVVDEIDAKMFRQNNVRNLTS